MSLALPAGRWTQAARTVVRTAAPVVLLAALAVITWWAGPLFLLVDLFAVACWRTPDPARIRLAIELLATGLVLLLTAVALLVGCARGRI
jgi:hypothetical protein